MTKLLQLIHVAALAVVTAMPAVSLAAEKAAAPKEAIVMTDSVRAKVTVVKIDSKDRKITLRDEKGSEMEVVAGEEVRNFKQIKKGDIVEVEYRVAVATALSKASDANVAGQATTVERAPAGSKPGGVVTHTRSIVATVLEIDKKNRTLTAQGPKGGVVTVKVPADMKTFDSLKKGDKISAIISEAVAISVKTPEKKK